MKPLHRGSNAGWQNWVGSFLRKFDAMDRALVAAGFHPTSGWWRQQIERYLRSGCRRWTIRAGRRAGKSSSMARLAVAWAKWGPWSVPPGDTAVIAFVSVDRDEASSRLRTIAEILRALGLTFDERSEELELHERRLVFKVFTSSVRSVGFTSVMLVGDEMARWESRDSAANPAKEVMASMRPTGATQPFWIEVAVSAPWSTDDYHAELFDQGDGPYQCTSFAPTWVANPTISEADTHELEPDANIRQREYGAEPGATVSAALDQADFEACRTLTPRGLRKFNFISTDASSLRNDSFAWIEGWQSQLGELVIESAHAFEGAELRGLKMSQVVDQIATRAHGLGVRVVFGDQREDASLISMFGERSIVFDSIPWSEQSKDTAFKALNRLLRDRMLIPCNHEKLVNQCRTARVRLMPSGRVKYETNGKDYLSALVTLAHRVVSGHIGVTFDPNAEQRAWAERFNRTPVRELSPFDWGPGYDRQW
jgi:hypothetical protein